MGTVELQLIIDSRELGVCMSWTVDGQGNCWLLVCVTGVLTQGRDFSVVCCVRAAARRRQKREEREAAEAAAAAGGADTQAQGDSTAAADAAAAAAGNGVSVADSSTSTSASTSADASVDASAAATATGSSTAADTDGEEGGGMDPEEVAQYAAAAAVDYEYSGEGPVAPELYFKQQVGICVLLKLKGLSRSAAAASAVMHACARTVAPLPLLSLLCSPLLSSSCCCCCSAIGAVPGRP